MALKGDSNRQMEDTKRKEQHQIKKQKKMECFSRNALLLIRGMVELNAAEPTLLLDEILHSIFFLGKLDDPEFSPERMARYDAVKTELNNPDCSTEPMARYDANVKMLKELRELFPRPFALYSSHLPKRSPFSCVLDMIVQLYGRKVDENEIIERLQDFIKKLKPGESNGLVIPEPKDSKSKVLVSSTICVSQSDIPESVRYYGVSMSTSGCHPGRIMIAASCLSSWDSKVADAVMTYYPEKTKNTDFDGTIELPHQPHVRCQAFNLSDGTEKFPCRSCGNLFGLETSETTESDYGNCAEAESLSNLLKEVENVRKQVRQTSEKCTDKNRETVKESVLKELKRLLRYLGFEWDNEEDFYEPRVRS